MVRLPDGNTPANLGFREDTLEPLGLVEARPDGSVAWTQSPAAHGTRASR